MTLCTSTRHYLPAAIPYCIRCWLTAGRIVSVDPNMPGEVCPQCRQDKSLKPQSQARRYSGQSHRVVGELPPNGETACCATKAS
jgi:hypothetical protein